MCVFENAQLVKGCNKGLQKKKKKKRLNYKQS